ncbi:MAG: hypothetical protein WC371_00560 [Parachlamydiales bacterium]|jgi:thioester reductase-like protein
MVIPGEPPRPVGNPSNSFSEKINLFLKKTAFRIKMLWLPNDQAIVACGKIIFEKENTRDQEMALKHITKLAIQTLNLSDEKVLLLQFKRWLENSPEQNQPKILQLLLKNLQKVQTTYQPDQLKRLQPLLSRIKDQCDSLKTKSTNKWPITNEILLLSTKDEHLFRQIDRILKILILPSK